MKILELSPAHQYDLIFANILKRPLIDLAPDISGHISSGGQAIISGILDEQAEEIIDFYQQNDLVVFDRIDIGEWVTLTRCIWQINFLSH